MRWSWLELSKRINAIHSMLINISTKRNQKKKKRRRIYFETNSTNENFVVFFSLNITSVSSKQCLWNTNTMTSTIRFSNNQSNWTCFMFTCWTAVRWNSLKNRREEKNETFFCSIFFVNLRNSLVLREV